MDTQKKRYFNVRPVVIIAAGLIFGILTAFIYLTKSAMFSLCLFILIISVCVFCGLFFLLRKNNGAALLALLTLIFYVLGSVFLIVDTIKDRPVEVEFTGNFKGTVNEIIKEETIDGGYYYSMVASGDIDALKDLSVRITVDSNKRIYVGSNVEFYGKYSVIEITENTISLGYNIYANVEGDITVGGVTGTSAKLKLRLLNALQNTMLENYGVNYALLVGDTQYIPHETLSKYRDTGIAHMFAVSGLHVGLMFAVVSAILNLFGLKRGSKFIITTILLALYAGFCGLSASTLRAFIIITVAQIAKLFGCKNDRTTAVAVSSIIVLFINPTDIFNVGFLLSYAVYIGLILLTNPIKEGLGKLLPQKLSSYLAPYFAASLTSFPILLSTFGYASIFSFLFNMLIVPAVTFFYAFSLFGGILVIIFPTAWIFSVVPNLLFTAIGWLLNSVNTSLFMIKGVTFGFSVIPLYALMYSYAEKINLSAKNYKILRITLVLAFILSFIAVNIIIKP